MKNQNPSRQGETKTLMKIGGLRKAKTMESSESPQGNFCRRVSQKTETKEKKKGNYIKPKALNPNSLKET